MLWMLLTPAVDADYAEIVELANWAYRGSGPSASWNMEVGILEGQRLNESLIREDLAAKPQGHLLTYREESGGMLLGTAWLDPREGGVWCLALFMIRPDQQNKQLGSRLLDAAESFAKERGARRIRMTVLHVRSTLIAWYERRGYAASGEIEPFPYGDDRFGRPLREDLHFLVFEKDIGLS
jgi:ribosomal protein S18 acetylase RimI-like enzyme